MFSYKNFHFYLKKLNLSEFYWQNLPEGFWSAAEERDAMNRSGICDPDYFPAFSFVNILQKYIFYGLTGTILIYKS